MYMLCHCIFRRNATHCISTLCYRHVCVYVSVCLSLCMYAAFVDLRKTVCDRDTVFFKLLGMTPDITCKSFTQIGLQIPRWRTK